MSLGRQCHVSRRRARAACERDRDVARLFEAGLALEAPDRRAGALAHHPVGGARIVTELLSSAWARETSATFSFCAPELVAASSPHSAFAASSLASGFADFACHDFTASSAAASDTGSSFVFARRFVASLSPAFAASENHLWAAAAFRSCPSPARPGCRD